MSVTGKKTTTTTTTTTVTTTTTTEIKNGPTPAPVLTTIGPSHTFVPTPAPVLTNVEPSNTFVPTVRGAAPVSSTICNCSMKIGVNSLTPDLDGTNGTLDGIMLWLYDKDSNITLNNGQKCQIEIISANNENNSTIADAIAQSFVDQGVVAMVGPSYSRLAIPVGQIAEEAKTPMIATTASNPNVTAGRSFVYRVSFSDTEQGPLLAALTAGEFNSSTAAIIYQADDIYSSYLANGIKAYWEYLNNSLAAFVSFNKTNIEESNFETQASEIANANASVLFAPIQGQQVSGVMNAIEKTGWHGIIVGSDGWSESDIFLKECGKACVGAYFSANFISDGSVGYSKRFVDKYVATYGVMPSDKAALAYDAMNLIKEGLEQNGQWTCDLSQNRVNLERGIQNITNFQGVGGDIHSFDANGDPVDKCITIGRVSNTSEPTFLYRYCAGSL